jgi:hypothetical protein
MEILAATSRTYDEPSALSGNLHRNQYLRNAVRLPRQAFDPLLQNLLIFQSHADEGNTVSH